MANFTDAISQFNPYVEQVPVELMGQVGIYKQAAYDQGVQKIQSQIDRISGLQVLHPEDKAYIQSKINGLTDRLRNFASADFSNQQLLSSVSGMTNELLKDNNIVSAVQVTANLKKQQEIMDKASQEGKSSPSNEWVFNQGLSKYLETKDPQQRSYYKNFKYTPYNADLMKKLIEAGKSVGLNSEEVEQIYQTDSLGNTLYKKDASGKTQAIPNEISATQKVSTKDVEKIKSTLLASLDQRDLEQLRIDSQYHFRNLNKSSLIEDSESFYKQGIRSISDRIEELQINLNLAKNEKVTDSDKISTLQKAIQDNEKVKTTYSNNLKTLDERLQNLSEDDLKFELYKDMTLSNLAKGFSSKESSIKYDVSPAFKIFDSNRDYMLSKDNYLLALASHEYKKTQDAVDNGLKRAQFIAEHGYSPEEASTRVKSPTILETPTSDVNGTSYYVENLSKISNDLQRLDYLAEGIYKNLKGGDLKAGKSTNSQLGEMHKVIGNILNQYDNNPESASINPNVRDAIREYRKLLINTNAEIQQLKTISKKEEDDYLLRNPDKKINNIETIISETKPVNIKLQGNQSFTLSPQDQVMLALSMPEQFHYFGRFGTDKSEDIRKEDAVSYFVRKYGEIKFKEIQRALFTPVAYTGALELNPQIKYVGNKLFSQQSKDIAENIGKSLLNIDRVAAGASVTYDKKEDKDVAISIVNNRGTELKQKPELLKALQLDNSTITVNAIGDNSGNINHVLKINDPKSGETVSIPITPNEYSNFSKSINYKNEPLPALVKQLNLSGTTNSNGMSWFTSSDFSNYKTDKNSRYTLLGGDFVKSVSNPNVAYFQVYIADKTKNNQIVPKQLDQPFYINSDSQKMLNAPIGVTSNVINFLMNQ